MYFELSQKQMDIQEFPKRGITLELCLMQTEDMIRYAHVIDKYKSMFNGFFLY